MIRCNMISVINSVAGRDGAVVIATRYRLDVPGM